MLSGVTITIPTVRVLLLLDNVYYLILFHVEFHHLLFLLSTVVHHFCGLSLVFLSTLLLDEDLDCLVCWLDLAARLSSVLLNLDLLVFKWDVEAHFARGVLQELLLLRLIIVIIHVVTQCVLNLVHFVAYLAVLSSTRQEN